MITRRDYSFTIRGVQSLSQPASVTTLCDTYRVSYRRDSRSMQPPSLVPRHVERDDDVTERVTHARVQLFVTSSKRLAVEELTIRALN